jgi:hypothetical protein
LFPPIGDGHRWATPNSGACLRLRRYTISFSLSDFAEMNRIAFAAISFCLTSWVSADETLPNVVDRSTLTGKVMCGYQGWFNCEGDGAQLGWTHWSRSRSRAPSPGNVTVDLWPDVTEYEADERYATDFKLSDGRAAEVFSSGNRKTVLRHFQWMQQYGIDGAFLQRFASGLKNRDKLDHKNTVLTHVREGANRSGRAFAVMYDLTGLGPDDGKLVQRDWLLLGEKFKITNDDSYLHHEGKPVVAIWGIGFNDGRRYTLEYCHRLVNWFKTQECTVMLGVPTYWRTLERDAVADASLHQTIRDADIVSPWSVGRYTSPEHVERDARQVWTKDRAWCNQQQIDLLPVVFPGFSWHNLKGAPLDAIPRRKGEFLWSQVVAAKRAGCDMIYVAMFDEVDEGTAIFKCTNDLPVGDGVEFLDYEGLPSDHYLRIAGAAGKLLRGELGLSDKLPRQLNEPE